VQVTISVNADITFPDALTPEHRRELLAAFSIPNPEHAMRKRRNLWLGGTPEKLSVCNIVGGMVHLPRGCLGEVIRILTEQGYSVLPEYKPVSVSRASFDLLVTLRDYQGAAVDALELKQDWQHGGVVVAPPGAGKTIIGCGAIARFQYPALVIVHTKDLLTQWCERIKAALNVVAGTIGGGRKAREAVVTVAMIQSLVRMRPQAIADMGERFPVVVVDECHHVPASTYVRALGLMSSPIKVGLTATPERNDGLTKYLEWYIGPIVHTIDHRGLVEDGHLVLPRIIPVETDFDATPDVLTLSCSLCRRRWEVAPSSLGDRRTGLPCPSCVGRAERNLQFAVNGSEAAGKAYRLKRDAETSAQVDTDFAWFASEVTLDDQRNRTIRAICQAEVAEGRRVLVLSGRVDHSEWLAAFISIGGVKATALTGESTKGHREGALEALRSGDIDVLCATSLADEGLDVVKLDTVILAAPQRAAGRTLQRVGRTMRPSPGKSPRVFDLVDTAGVLRNQWYARKRAYKKLLGVWPERARRY